MHEAHPRGFGDDGNVVGTYRTYDDAAEAVSRLAEREYPIEKLTIVGRGVTVRDVVTGPPLMLRRVVDGALTGALAGLLFGIVVGFFNVENPAVAASALGVYGFFFGGLIGLIVASAAGHLTGRRGFSAVRFLTAEQFDVVAPRSDALDAHERLRAYRRAS